MLARRLIQATSSVLKFHSEAVQCFVSAPPGFERETIA